MKAHVFRQGSLPGGGAHSLKVAQLVHTGHRHRRRRASGETGQGSHGWAGHIAHQPASFWLCTWGGEASRRELRYGLPESSGIKRDWQTEAVVICREGWGSLCRQG